MYIKQLGSRKGVRCVCLVLVLKNGSNLTLGSDDNEHKVRQYADDAVVQSSYTNMITRLRSPSATFVTFT